MDGDASAGAASSLLFPSLFPSFFVPSFRSIEGEKSICYFFGVKKREKWDREISTLLGRMMSIFSLGSNLTWMYSINRLERYRIRREIGYIADITLKIGYNTYNLVWEGEESLIPLKRYPPKNRKISIKQHNKYFDFGVRLSWTTLYIDAMTIKA